MPNNGHDDRSGREIRLLLLVVAVAVAVLLVLARFRFPQAEIVGVSPTPNPLERMATRAPFDDLADAVADSASRLGPLMVTIELGPAPVRSERPDKKGGRVAAAPAGPRRFMPGLRVRPDLILVHVPAGLTPILASGSGQVIGADAEREIALLVLVAGASGAPAGRESGPVPAMDLATGASGFAGASYVLVADAGAAGAAIRPVFLAKTSAAAIDRWSTPLLRVAGEPQAARGTFLFTLDGRLIGLVVGPPDALTIADSTALDRAVTELAGGRQ